MGTEFDEKMQGFLDKKGKRKLWRIILSIAVAFTVFITTYTLILPALTMEQTYCGEKEHSHSVNKGCYKEVEELTCKNTEEGHKHNKDCYETKLELICNKDSHSHNANCYSDLNADLESETDWTKSLSKVSLTGNWDKDIVAVASSQLGVKESSKNYKVDKEGNKRGYSRYGEWYGDPYGAWNASFLSFCLNYARIDKIAIKGSAIDFYEEVSKLGLYHKISEANKVAVGDIIFLDTNKDSKADRVGIISEIKEKSIKSIEGDYEREVAIREIETESAIIMGYASMPKNPKASKKEDSKEEEELNNQALKERESKTEERTEEANSSKDNKESEDKKINLKTNSKNYIEVVLSGPADAFDYPNEELSLQAVEIENKKAKALLEEEAGLENRANIKRRTLLFDIKVMHGEEEVQPKKPVEVTFSGIETPRQDAKIYHVEKNTVKDMSARKLDNDSISMRTPHFSIYGVTYTVDFHYGDYEFSILGLDKIKLSELFEKLQIEKEVKEVKEVSFSNASLLKVEKVENDWELESLKAFTSEETLRVIFNNGEELEIKVTDAPASGIGASYVAGTGKLALNVSKVTGTAPWDGDDNAGNDASPINDIVRSFDSIYYKVAYTMNLTDKYNGAFKGYKKANLYIEASLPLDNDQAEFVLDAMPWLSNARITKVTGSGGDVSQKLTGYYAMDAGNLDYILPSTGTVKLAVNVKNMPNGSSVKPSIKAWLDSNQKESADPTDTKVSSKESYDVKLEYLNSGDVTTRNFGISVCAKLDDKKGAKGAYIDLRDISFDLLTYNQRQYTHTSSASYTRTFTGNSGEANITTYTPLLYDYSLINNNSEANGSMGKTLSIFGTDIDKTMGRIDLPYSSRIYGNTKNAVFDSGEMSVVQGYKGDQRIHVTFSNIKSDFDFPQEVAKGDKHGNIKKISDSSLTLATGIVQIGFKDWAWSTRDAIGWSTTRINRVNLGNVNITNSKGQITTIKESDANNNSWEDIYRYTYTALASGTRLFSYDEDGARFLDDENAARQDRKMSRGTIFYVAPYAGSGATGVYTTGSDHIISYDPEIYEPLVDNADDVITGVLSNNVNISQTIAQNNRLEDVDVRIYFLDGYDWERDHPKNAYIFRRFKTLTEARNAGVTPTAIYLEVRDKKIAAKRFHSYLTPTSILKFRIREDAPITPKTAIAPSTVAWNEIIAENNHFENRDMNSYTLENYKSRNESPFDEIHHILLSKAKPSSTLWVEFAGRDTNGNFVGQTYDHIRDGGFTWWWNTNSWHATVTIVTDKEVDIKKSVSQQINGKDRNCFTLDNGDYNVDYTLSPRLYFENIVPSQDRYSDITITDTLPKELSYVSGSSYIGGTYKQPVDMTTSGSVIGGNKLTDNGTVTGANTTTDSTGDVTMSVVKNTDGTTTLKWVITNVKAGKDMPKIYYSTKIGNGENLTAFKDGQQISNSVTIDSKSSNENIIDNSGAKTVTSTITVSKLDKSTLIKSVDKTEVDLDEDISYTIDYTNDSGNNISSMEILDLLPYNGDDRGSKFSGNYTIDKVTVERSNDAVGTYSLAYSTDTSVRGHEKDVFAAGFNPTYSNVNSSASGKLTTFALLGNTSPTMLKITGTNIGAYAKAKITITLHPRGNKDKDIYLNDTAYNTGGIPEPVYAVPVETKVNQGHFDLEVSKAVVGAITTDNFEFDIDILNGQTRYKAANGSFTVYDKNNDELIGVASVSNEGRITVKLSDGDRLVVKNVPKDYKATITEKVYPTYTTSYKINKAASQAGTSATLTINGNQKVEFTNTLNIVNLKVKKTVQGLAGGSFNFTASFKDGNGNYVTIPADTANPARYTIKVDPNNSNIKLVDFNLKNGESVTIKGVPIGTLATLTEINPEGYSVLINDVNGGNTISKTSIASIIINKDEEIEVINNSGLELPASGGPGSWLYILIGAGIISIALAVGIYVKRKKSA